MNIYLPNTLMQIGNYFSKNHDLEIRVAMWKRLSRLILMWCVRKKSPYYSCLSKNFSITTENAAKPAHPMHAAFGPPKKHKKLWLLSQKYKKNSWWHCKGKRTKKRTECIAQQLWVCEFCMPILVFAALLRLTLV